MYTAPYASSDPPTLPAGVLTARVPVRSTAVASAWNRPAQARPARARRTLLARLMIDLGLCLRLAFAVAEGLLAMRALLVLLGGDPSAVFSTVIYSATGPLVAPFADVFHGAVSVAGQQLDATAILALVAYMIFVRLAEATLKTLARL